MIHPSYVEVMKGYKDFVKQGNISNAFDDRLKDFANEISNDDRLSREEKQKLLRKLSRIADKADKINKASRDHYEEVEAEAVEYDEAQEDVVDYEQDAEREGHSR